MEIFEAIIPISVSALLREVHNGSMVLPDFQRDFVWDPTATQGLLVSISNKYPAGSLLRARDTRRDFETRAFDKAPEPRGLHTYLVLDGQQRLTSLYHALYGEGDYRFFIDLKLALLTFSLDKNDETIFLRRTRGRGVQDLENDITRQASELVLPVSVFNKRNGGFWKWVTDVRDELGEAQRADFERNMQQLHGECLRNFEEYQFPVVTLNQEVPTEALCTIFETLNKTGVKLTIFELLTARFARYGISLRTLWETAKNRNPILEEYDIDPYSALQAISLLVSGSCQKKKILDLTKVQLEENWDLIINSLVKGLEILRDDCKVMNRKWLPTPSMVGPLATLCAISSQLNPHGPELGVHKRQIIRWLWCAMFGQRYEAAANTRAERDVRDMRAWFEGGPIPEMINLFRFEKETLYEVSSKAGSIYKSVICLTMASEPHARDFHNGNIISFQMVNNGEVDDHHIFPAAYLENIKGITRRAMRDCVLNRTLIDRVTNQQISDRPPSEYLRDIDAQLNADDILNSHLIPIGKDSPIRVDDFELFLSKRADLIVSAIGRVTS
jgi:hypothetical protein